MTRRRAIDVKVDGKWTKCDTLGEAASLVGVTDATLIYCLRLGKPCNGFEVRDHEELQEIDICLREIEERNRQPYQFTNGREPDLTPREPEKKAMNKTELITHLYEMTAEIEELRAMYSKMWFINEKLKDVASKIQVLMHEINDMA